MVKYISIVCLFFSIAHSQPVSFDIPEEYVGGPGAGPVKFYYVVHPTGPDDTRFFQEAERKPHKNDWLNIIECVFPQKIFQTYKIHISGIKSFFKLSGGSDSPVHLVQATWGYNQERFFSFMPARNRVQQWNSRRHLSTLFRSFELSGGPLSHISLPGNHSLRERLEWYISHNLPVTEEENQEGNLVALLMDID